MSEGPQRKPHYKIFLFATRRHSHQPTSPTLTRTPSARPPSPPAATPPSTLAASPHEDAQSQSPASADAASLPVPGATPPPQSPSNARDNAAPKSLTGNATQTQPPPPPCRSQNHPE